MERKKKMRYPRWEYNKKDRELTIYYGEYQYTTFYDDDAEALYKDLEFGRPKDVKIILNELYLDFEQHNDPYRRSDDLM